jgi:hypothetical protein
MYGGRWVRSRSSNTLRPETQIGMHLRTHLVLCICTVGQTITHLLDIILDALKTVIFNGPASRSKDYGAWLLDNLHSFREPSSALPRQVVAVIPLTVSQTPFFLEKKHNGVGFAVSECDMKLFLVAWVSGFMAKRLLNDSICDTCKLISEVPSLLDIYTGFTEHNSRYSWHRCDCFEECDVEGGWKSVELYVTDAVKKDVDFDWIRSAGRSLHC